MKNKYRRNCNQGPNRIAEVANNCGIRNGLTASTGQIRGATVGNTNIRSQRDMAMLWL